MRKFFTFIVVATVAVPHLLAQAQTLPIFNRFDNYLGYDIGTTYFGWSEGNGEGTPVLEEASWFHSTTLYNHAACVQINQTDKRAWLLTPSFVATENAQLSFTAAMTLIHNEPEDPIFGAQDFFKVMVQVGNTNFTELMVFGLSNPLSTKMQPFTINLGSYAGAEIRIGFLAMDGNQAGTYSTWHIDDVYITDASAPDVAAEEILSPKWNSCLTGSTPVVVRIKNNDTQPVMNVPVRVRIRGAHNQNMFNVYQGMLQPSQTVELTVGNADFSLPGTYSLVAVTELESDVFTENNLSNPLTFNKYDVAGLPMATMDFTGFYTDNLITLYPNWYEARGKIFPKAIMDTDWQGDDHPDSRTASVFFAALGTADWLIGPTIQATQNTIISFKAAYEWYEGASQMGSDDKLAVMVSRDCGATWTEIGAISRQSNLCEGLTPFTFSFAQFAGEAIQIAIYATSGTVSDSEQYIVHIDDVVVRDAFQVDLAMGNIVSPSASCSFTNSETLSVEIRNVGLSSVTNPQVSYVLNEGEMVTETMSGTILPGATHVFSFETTLNLTTQTANTVSVSVEAPTDGDLENNSITAILKPSSFDLNTMGTFFTSFETGEEVESWTVQNANNDGHLWQIVDDPTYALTGTKSFNYQSNQSSVASNDWLFSPCFTLEAGFSYYVSFHYKNRATSYPEKLKFTLNTAAMANSVLNVINDFGDISNSNFVKYESTVSVPTTGSYYFAWQAYGPADMFGMYIDDVTVYRVFDSDLAIVNAYPVRLKDENSCEVLPANTLKVDVKNMGSSSMEGFVLSASIEQGETVINLSQSFTNTLAAGEQILVSFTEGLELNPQEIYDIELSIENEADLNEANNVFATENVDLRTYYTGFEVDDENAEWTVINLTGTNTWHIDNTPDLAHSGTKYYRIRTDQQSTDDWLISGCHELRSGVCYSLSFFYRSRYSTENLEVYIGPNPTDEGMVNILNINNFNSNIYLSSTSQFSVPDDGVYYLAFRTAGGTSQKYYIHIDDITLKVSDESPVVEPHFAVLDKEVMFFANAQYINDCLWDFGNGNTSSDENPTFTFPGAGTYPVTLTATGACGVLTQEITVDIESALEASFSFDVDGPVVTFEAQTNATSAAWNFGDGNFGSGLTTFNQYLLANTYPVTLTVYDGISSLSVSQNVTITVNNVAEVAPSEVQLYPNPASNSITVQGAFAGSLIRFYDLTGKDVRKVSMESSSETIDISDLAPGIYLFRIQENSQEISGRFIKQ